MDGTGVDHKPAQMGNGSSLPRPIRDGRGDTWGEINAAHALGIGDTGDFAAGGALASRAVAQVPGLPIDHRVAPGFVGFRQVSDAPGGVDVAGVRAFTDDHYPDSDNASVAPRYRTVHFDADVQHRPGRGADHPPEAHQAPRLRPLRPRHAQVPLHPRRLITRIADER